MWQLCNLFLAGPATWSDCSAWDVLSICLHYCRLEPGEVWKGEVALRWHDKYWEIPLFEKGPQPGGISDQLMPGYEKHDRERKMPVLPPRRKTWKANSRMPAVTE